MPDRTCTIYGCTNKLVARGWCANHYAKWRRTGTPERPTREQRFFGHIEQAETGCWEWQGTRTSQGYGQFYADDLTHKAHRWAYEFLRCEIPTGLELDHLCRNTSCVNPWHVEPVPMIENQRRRRGVYGSDLSKCMHGHPMTADNVYVNPQGVRICRICDRERVRRNRRKKVKGAV